MCVKVSGYLWLSVSTRPLVVRLLCASLRRLELESYAMCPCSGNSNVQVIECRMNFHPPGLTEQVSPIACEHECNTTTHNSSLPHHYTVIVALRDDLHRRDSLHVMRGAG